ncbi:MAG: hypothetical protein MUF15_26095, partial [Acidobacteria bacterium]|nr:hypothetical protein [Acidobacteriota bacterium]
VDLRFMNRQTIETYENIDPEQAAILLKNLYIKDPSLVILIMKKISGRKAGRILDALLLTDRDLATKIAEETLNFYRPK